MANASRVSTPPGLSGSASDEATRREFTQVSAAKLKSASAPTHPRRGQAQENATHIESAFSIVPTWVKQLQRLRRGLRLSPCQLTLPGYLRSHDPRMRVPLLSP